MGTTVLKFDETFRVQNLDEVSSLLLKPYRVIELVPFELINNGSAVRLVPARNNETLRVDDKDIGVSYIIRDSLPVIDLHAAGIEMDRRPETIFSEVTKILSNQQFTITASDFDPIAIRPWLPMIAVGQLAKLEILKLKASRGILQPHDFNPEKELREIATSMITGTFTISGKSFPGLDVSKEVEGELTTVADFLLPYKYLKEDTVCLKAVESISELCLITNTIKRHKESYAEHVAKNSGKWWFRFWNKKKMWSKEISRNIADRKKSLLKAEEAIAALP